MVKGFKDVRGMALERIDELFSEASNEFKKNHRRSDKYVKIALRLAAKSGVRIPKKHRRSYCRKCKSYLSSGSNSKIRTRDGKLVVSCLVCGSHRRIVLKPKA
jgi:ribonuclease P protein subunit RPR2